MSTAAVKINLADNTLAGNNAAVVAALNAAGVGSGLVKHNLENISGDVTPDLSNGAYQYCVVNGNTNFQTPSGGTTGDTIEIEIQWADDARTLNFTGIKMPTEAAALLPVTLEAYRCYLITLRHLGGGWTLVDITPANTESLD